MLTPNNEIKTLLTGLAIGESPRWHQGRLWFSNWGRQEIIAVDADGRSEVIVKVPATLPFCIDWLPDGRLLVVAGSEGLLLRMKNDGRLVTHADLRSLAQGWNEIAVDDKGHIFVNGGGFDLMAGEPFKPGIIALVNPDGSLVQVADDIAFPNGMAITPDNKTLLIAESYGKKLTAFDIAKDGSLLNRRVWANLGNGAPDGICIDAENAVWYADVPNRRCVRVREGGEVLQTVNLDRGCFACALGGQDMKTLFIMAAEWKGPDKMFEGELTGRIFTTQVQIPGVYRGTGFQSTDQRS